MASSKVIPEVSVIEQAAQLDVYDVNGGTVKFGSLFEKQKIVVVFIRHFFCGSCQSYVKQFASVKPQALASAAVELVVIGCGEWKAIQAYAEMTGFQGKIYADPSRKLYRSLGMTIENIKRTPAGEPKRSYITQGLLSGALSGIADALNHASLIGKQGNISQLGGDFVFGPGLQCSYASRMQHTEDHVEVSDLMKIVGVEFT